MGGLLNKLRKNWKVGLYWTLGVIVAAAVVDFHTGLLEETGWSARQIGAKVGKRFTATHEKGKLETGSIQQVSPKPELTEAQKKEAGARAKKVRCERERGGDLMEAEKNLAIHGYVVNLCIAEARQSVFTAGNPERACKVQIDARGASEERRDGVAGRKC